MNMIFEEGVRQALLGNTSFQELRDLPRGDYVMKSPDQIMRDATETAETRRVDLPTSSKAFVAPPAVTEKVVSVLGGVSVQAVKTQEPQSATLANGSADAKPKSGELRLSDASVDRLLSNSKLRNQLIMRLLQMSEEP